MFTGLTNTSSISMLGDQSNYVEVGLALIGPNIQYTAYLEDIPAPNMTALGSK